MKYNLIISPHCDDSIWSMGSYIQTLENVVVISPFDAVPADDKGRRKHTILNHEHKEACYTLGINVISGVFFDDVYAETRNIDLLPTWFFSVIDRYVGNCEIYVPLGIHHPDHIIVRDIFIKHFKIDYFYCELPYYIRYPEIKNNLESVLCSGRTLITAEPNKLKETAVKTYVSQVDDTVLKDCLVTERIWK